MATAGKRTLRDLLCDLAVLPDIGAEFEVLGECLSDLADGEDSESSDDMLQRRVHDQLDVICSMLGRETA